MMMKNVFKWMIVLCSALFAVQAPVSGSPRSPLRQAQGRPNIIFFLADDLAYQDVLNAMFAEMQNRWDEDDLDQRIRASQRKRIFVQDAMKHGRFPSWDFAPHYDPAKVYVRGGTDPSTTATKQRGRFPYVPVTKPQYPRQTKK